jgi:hypothetical protein
MSDGSNLWLEPREGGGYDAFWLRVIKPKPKQTARTRGSPLKGGAVAGEARFFTWWARLDAQARVVGAPRQISEPHFRRVVRGGGGFGALLSEFRDGRWSTTAHRCLGDGSLSCAQRAALPPSPVGHGSPALVWSARRGEFVVVHEELVGGPGNARNHIVLYRLDEGLRLIEGSRRVLFGPEQGWSTFSNRGPGLVVTPTGYAAAWVEGKGTGEGSLVLVELSDTGATERRTVVDSGNIMRASLATDGARFLIGYTHRQRARAARVTGGAVDGRVTLGADGGYQGDVVVDAGPGGFVVAWTDQARGARWARVPERLPSRIGGESLGDKTGWPWDIVDDACGVTITTHEGRVHRRR